MSVLRSVKDRSNPFVQIDKRMLEDPNLSLKAKGFIAYCMSKPNNWQFHITYLESVLKEGERAIYSTIDEAQNQGYALRFQTRKENGDFDKWETIISDSKAEIALIKKELENDPDFQRSFTLRRFADAQVADAQSVSLNNNETSKSEIETTEQQAPVVCPEPNEMKAKLTELLGSAVVSCSGRKMLPAEDDDDPAMKFLLAQGIERLVAKKMLSQYSVEDIQKASIYTKKALERKRAKNEPIDDHRKYFHACLKGRYWEKK